jgi:hypothetical protein
MDIHDYLLESSEVDWGRVLRDWAPPLPVEFTVWLVNRIGDVFVVFDDGSVHMLDVGAGLLTRCASSRDEFAELLDVGDHADRWLMIPVIDRCRAAGMALAANQCYGFKVPPMLGGGYDSDNLEPTDVQVHYGLLADIFRQTKDLPDGTRVRVVVD